MKDVIGIDLGGMSAKGGLFTLSGEPLRKAVNARSYIAMDIGAKLGNKAGIYGAYALASDNLDK